MPTKPKTADKSVESVNVAEQTATADAPAFAFTDAEKVSRSRETKPNPFADVIRDLATQLTEDVSESSAKAFVVPEGVSLTTVKNQLAAAGDQHGVTVRKHADDDTRQVTFHVRTRITRKSADA